MTQNLNLKYYAKQRQVFEDSAKITIITKGRRVGATQGSLQYILEQALACKYKRILYVDTTYNNIIQIVKLYIGQLLIQLPKALYEIRDSYKTLLIYPGSRKEVHIALRSADNPKTIEGFKYDLIVVNEAGVILDKDLYLIENALMPMLMDNAKARMIISGTPKGKNAYYRLYNDAKKHIDNGNENNMYALYHLSPYENPFIDHETIKIIEDSYDSYTALQEIHGQFVENDMLVFCYEFTKDRIKEPPKEAISIGAIHVSFDFNVSPMTCLLYFYYDNKVYVYKEFSKNNSDIYQACRWVKHETQNMRIFTVTGDASGNNRSALTQDNATYYNIIKNELQLGSAQMRVPNSNITHVNSRIIVNSAIRRGDIYVSNQCRNLLYDIEFCNIESSGTIDKSDANRGHLLDGFRYIAHLHYSNKILKL